MKLLAIFFAAVLHHAFGQYNYSDIIRQSILFYEAERSGDLPESNRIPYRGDSALGDGSDVGLDLTGGWYDAGDHVKFGFPMAWSTTILAWGIWQFSAAYESAGEMANALDSIRWPLDYFIKCHVSDTEFYGQLGDGYEDHAYWGRPEEMTMYRPAWKVHTAAPGSDLAATTAAAFAAGSMAFKSSDSAYADTLLDHGRRLYEFAYNYRGIYSNSIPNAACCYGSSGYTDELAFGAIWLYIATEEQQYMDRALEFYSSGTPWAYSWDDVNAGVQVLMYQATQDAQYSGHVEAFLRSWFPGGGVTYTPGGLAWRDQWGPNRYAGNAAAIAVLAASQGIIADEAEAWAKTQIDYMLGSNPLGISYVIGYSGYHPLRPHHRSSSCNPDHSIECDWDDFNRPEPNPSVLWGALVGGPNQNDEYNDARDDYVANEVANDYNAGFQTAVAGIL